MGDCRPGTLSWMMSQQKCSSSGKSGCRRIVNHRLEVAGPHKRKRCGNNGEMTVCRTSHSQGSRWNCGVVIGSFQQAQNVHFWPAVHWVWIIRIFSLAVGLLRKVFTRVGAWFLLTGMVWSSLRLMVWLLKSKPSNARVFSQGTVLAPTDQQRPFCRILSKKMLLFWMFF